MVVNPRNCQLNLILNRLRKIRTKERAACAKIIATATYPIPAPTIIQGGLCRAYSATKTMEIATNAAIQIQTNIFFISEVLFSFPGSISVNKAVLRP